MAAAAIAFGPPSPILRIFDDEKAREFYCHFLGFRLVWEHRFEPGLPLYAEVERAGLRLHLSGHHGDACPGSTVFVRLTGIRAFQAELLAQDYGFARPVIEELPWGLVMEIADPFGNRLRFCEEEVEGLALRGPASLGFDGGAVSTQPTSHLHQTMLRTALPPLPRGKGWGEGRHRSTPRCWASIVELSQPNLRESMDGLV